MADKKEEKPKFEYLKGIMAFYFAPKLRSFLTVLHFVIWSFVTIYYLEYLLFAARLILYIAFKSKILLSISYLFWSLAFLIVLIIPFTLALYSILTIYQVWGKHANWQMKWRIFATVAIIAGSCVALIFMSDISHYVAGQSELRGFIEDAGLNGRL
jgi:hypothetical protein